MSTDMYVNRLPARTGHNDKNLKAVARLSHPAGKYNPETAGKAEKPKKYNEDQIRRNRLKVGIGALLLAGGVAASRMLTGGNAEPQDTTEVKKPAELIATHEVDSNETVDGYIYEVIPKKDIRKNGLYHYREQIEHEYDPGILQAGETVKFTDDMAAGWAKKHPEDVQQPHDQN